MILRHSILDLWELNEFIEPLNKGIENTRKSLGDILVDKYSYVLSLKDKPMIVVIERRSRYTANLHVYFGKETRGKQAVDFIKDVNEYLKGTDIRFVFNFTEDRKVKLFMGCFANSKHIGNYKGYSVYKTIVT